MIIHQEKNILHHSFYYLLTINELHNLISSNHLICIIERLEIFIFECKIKGRSTKVFMLK